MSSDFPSDDPSFNGDGSVDPIPSETFPDLGPTDEPAKDPSPSQNPVAIPLSLTGWFAWMVVVGMTLLLASTVFLSYFAEKETANQDIEPHALFQIEMQVKAIVAQKGFAKSAGNPAATEKALSDALETIDSGPYEHRICTAIVVNEVKGIEEAQEYLETLDEKVETAQLELTDDQSKLRSVLGETFSRYSDGDLDSSTAPENDRKFLVEKLGWVGELALVPPETPLEDQRQSVVGQTSGLIVIVMLVMVCLLVVFTIGLTLAIIFGVFINQKKIKSYFEKTQTNHNIYIETFAIWMVLFFGASIVMGLLGIDNIKTAIMLQPVVFFGSLISLLWPVARGVSFADVRRDIGWKSDRPAADVGSTFPAYFATLPWLVPAVFLVFLMVTFVSGGPDAGEFETPVTPSHPIQEIMVAGDTFSIAMVCVAAVICAPIVEETMFRGVLYRHLRDLTGTWSRFGSVFFSAALNGLIFASCHPQGIFGIPLLTTLAIGFSLAREWRGSLLTPMLMHAVHNGALTCLMLLFL